MPFPKALPKPLLRPPHPSPSRRTAHRHFQTSHALYIKEDAHRSPSELEAKKRDSLKKQQRGQGEWDKDLASKGEENVKADREDVGDHGEHMEELQREGAKKAERGDL
jgi:hypothetical protein